MKQIALTQGKVAIVDDEDYETLAALGWHVARRHSSIYYAIRNVCRRDGGRTTEQMHRVVLERKLGRLIVDGMQCDHINGNGIDNRRENLREVTFAQNQRNCRRRSANPSSQYLGVCWHNGEDKWVARICAGVKRISLGYHSTELAAAQAREAVQAKTAWALQSRGYAWGWIDGRHRVLHQFIWRLAHGEYPTERLDHKNRNKLDCRLQNLRIASNSQNVANSDTREKNRLGYKGVRKVGARFGAGIRSSSEQVWLGTFDTAEEAARAYDVKAKELFGEFAFLNFPGQPS